MIAIRPLAAIGLALAATLLLGACVERRLTIRSEPAGASVALDGDPLPGRTPVVAELTHHGTHRVEVDLADHRRAVLPVTTAAPWYDHFPLDFLAELLWPGRLVREDEVTVRLEPRPEEGPPEASLDRLLEEAKVLRRQALSHD